ncbi:hypothetical protein J2128_000315 [Methanomicrobium sp. W14]|uniref:hypothetical protein n=1 Tax=Methanomicrobium sp. W14 TaxID=2817839 RepID=UPI001AE6A8C9|nr:hypothetical protein [Methanomicrobium sp. W14]MBP2132394.1 hypothetical protein [Methanomicrobium sp. W14]
MEKTVRNILTAVILIFVVLGCVYVAPYVLSLFVGDPYQLDLVEMNSNLTDVENRTLVYLSEADFGKYPELRELFKDVAPISEETFAGSNMKIVSHANTNGKRAGEIRNEYSNKLICRNGGYYGILVQQP